MGKNDFLTPKAIANRIKAKGLQKLRWYCQVCQKQCRDENGFKCHQTSDSHRRQLELFGQNPARYVEGYSEEFETEFMAHLKRAHPHARISANVVYNEYINDRHHVHMNSTKWLTLTEFVKYLGKTGQCKVDETPKGWFIQLIQSDPFKDIEDGKKRKRDQAERDDDLRQLREIEKQVKLAGAGEEEDEERGGGGGSELVRGEGDQPLAFSVPKPGEKRNSILDATDSVEQGNPLTFGGQADEGSDQPPQKGRHSAKGPSKLEELMQREISAKRAKASAGSAKAAASSAHPGDWLHKGLVVKVLSKELKQHGYYKKKGVVEAVDGCVGEVCMLESGDVVRIDQRQLETVLPQIGGTVLLVNGKFKGARGVLLKLNVEKYVAQVELSSGDHEGRKIWSEYEDVCKLDKSVI